jgi:hypothetical protein
MAAEKHLLLDSVFPLEYVLGLLLIKLQGVRLVGDNLHLGLNEIPGQRSPWPNDYPFLVLF